MISTRSDSSPTWRCPEPALHVAPAGGPGGADGRRQRRRDRAGLLAARAAGSARLGNPTLEAEILKEAFEHATGSKNGCGCRRRRRRTVPDEDLGGSDWSLPLQSDGTHARATEETDWPAAAARQQTRGRGQGGHRRAANL